MLVAITLLGTFTVVAGASAQVIVGGNKRPSVTVDEGVLDRLGPPLTLPQRFLGERSPTHAPAARASRATPTRRATHALSRRAAPSAHHKKFAQAAPARTPPSRNQVIHLIPPAPRTASVAPQRTPSASTATPIHEQAALSEPSPPTVAALAAQPPVPAPRPQPQPSHDLPPAVLPAVAAREITPAPAIPTTTAPPGAANAAVVMSAASAAPPPQSIAVAAAAVQPSAGPPSVSPSTPGVQMAAATTVGGGMSAIKFSRGATDLARGPQPALDSIAARLLANDNLRVQVIAHASGTEDDAMEARRISLARAVAVRAYLIDKGVRSLRIDVRALGNRSEGGPASDEVDLLVVSQ